MATTLKRLFPVVAICGLAQLCLGASGIEVDPLTVPSAPAPISPAPGTGIPAFDPNALSSPGTTAFPSVESFPGSMPTMGVPSMPIDGAVPTPPPLTSLGLVTDTSTTGTTASIVSQGPVETYEFLFRDDEDLGIVRDRFTFQEAQEIKEREINALLPKYQGANPQQQGQNQAQDPRAGASWDFYYQQLELYSDYVSDRVLEGVEDLPEPGYDADQALQQRNDLKAAYDLAAITLVSEQYNENRDFYDMRLQAREDRRRNYYEWLASQQRALDDWARLWARKINGLRWQGEAVRLDDWYYGMNFASRDPIALQVDGRSYLLSKEPSTKVMKNELNVLSSNLTPYDIIDANGVLKTPEMERLRGTIVRPPVAEVVSTGTIELVQ